jgi:hypothetical protein
VARSLGSVEKPCIFGICYDGLFREGEAPAEPPWATYGYGSPGGSPSQHSCCRSLIPGFFTSHLGPGIL